MEGFPITIRLPVLWGDMDAFGHVNNARYFVWFEAVRLELFQRVQLASSGTPGVGPILAHVSCDFLKPVVWPAEIIVGTRVTSFGRTSFKMDYAIAHASQPDELVATGEGVIVLVNYGTGEKIPVSEELKAAIEAL
ncbi:MAG: thioesterase family protein [Planctomycetota bacterium]|nr:thioesterase family protein [Planctomycetota bacterium]